MLYWAEAVKPEDQAAGLYLAELIRASLHDKKVEDLPDGCTLERVFFFAGKNAVEAVSFYGLTKEICEQTLYDRWKRAAEQTLYRQVGFGMEREQILEKMAEKGISYLPLKGILLAEYYPRPGMRSMADNDILYGYIEEMPGGGYRIRGEGEKEQGRIIQQAQNQVKEIMLSLGYEVKSLWGNHDCYIKEPFYNFELHRHLMPMENPLSFYYQNDWSRASQDMDYPWQYSFSDTDEYIYLLSHIYKHYSNSGCGIRSIVDQYVFLTKKGHLIDRDYLQGELKTLSLEAFEKSFTQLALHAFSEEGVLEEEDRRMFFYMLSGGTYGSQDQLIKNTMIRLAEENSHMGSAGWKYMMHRLFWTRERCKDAYPFFARHYYLIWFLPLYRIIRGLFRHPKALWQEWKSVWSFQKDLEGKEQEESAKGRKFER